MPTPFEHRLPSEHCGEDIWQAINTPLSGELARAVQPWFDIDYIFLDLVDDNLQVVEGTTISYRPSAALVSKVPEQFRDKLPEDITWRVEEYDPDNRTRLDVLESNKAEGTIQHSVLSGQNRRLLVIEGELSIAGLYSIAEGSDIKHAIHEPAQRLLEHLPEIIRER